MNSPVDTLTPIVERGGFTLVEEDDVAFSLSLCREINRIYGSYQSDDLEDNDSVHVGLALAAQVLSTLAGSVSKGMPAMRIEVAWAQTSEMMAVMFGEPISRKTGRASRQQLQKGCSHPPAALRPTPTANAIQAALPEPIVAGPEKSEPPQHNSEGPDSTGSPAQPEDLIAASLHSGARRWDRCRLWIAASPLWCRMLLGGFGCVLSAGLIDLPIVLLLLFSDLAVQLTTIYALVGLATWWVHRKRIDRSSGEDPVPSSNPTSWVSWNVRASPTCTAR